MSMYHTVTEKVLNNQAQIAQQTKDFLASGGKAQQIPRGQGAGLTGTQMSASIALDANQAKGLL